MSWQILIPDFGLSADELAAKYEKRERHPHPDLSPWGWRQVVANGKTRLGYWEWVVERLNDLLEELERDNPYA